MFHIVQLNVQKIRFYYMFVKTRYCRHDEMPLYLKIASQYFNRENNFRLDEHMKYV